MLQRSPLGFGRERNLISLRSGNATHPGRIRTRNEDAALCGPFIFAVADGMGGHDAGDVASQLTIEHLQMLAENADLEPSAIVHAIRTADDAVAAAGAERAVDMGTTLTGVAVLGDNPSELLVFNVGDSRVYRLRDGALSQITHDHSVVQELIDAQIISQSDAATHPDRHVITRSLGSGAELDIDWWPVNVAAGDKFLITSDGLVNEVDLTRISFELQKDRTPVDSAEELVRLAVAAGGRDNVTVVVIEVAEIGNGHPADPLDAVTAERPRTEPSPEHVLGS